jgi:hypothetical protein
LGQKELSVLKFFIAMIVHIVDFCVVPLCRLIDRNLHPENEAAYSSETFLSAHRTTRCHTPEHHKLNGCTIRVIKLIKMRWSGIVERMRKMRIAFKIIGKSEGKRVVWIEDDIKMDISCKIFWVCLGYKVVKNY